MMSNACSALSRSRSLAGTGNDDASLPAFSVADGIREIELEPPVSGGTDAARWPRKLLKGRESLNVRSFRNVEKLHFVLGAAIDRTG
jgi:hypothetical protein